MTPPVVGLVGVGNWGQHILRDLRTLGARVHAVARHPPSVERAARGGAESIVTRPEDLPSCDAFVIANRTIDHVDTVRRLLPRGRPIFVEKPLSPAPDEIRGLDSSAAGLVFVMHKWRYHPGIQELARIARSEEFGPVRGLRTFRLGGDVPHEDVNAIWVLLPHDLSIALEILGEVPAPVAAFRDPLTPCGGGLIARLVAHGQGVDVVIEVSSGHLRSHRAVVLACRDAVSELRGENHELIEIRRRDASRGEPPIRRSVPADLPLYEELRAFLDFVAGGPPPKTSFAEELRIIKSIETLQAFL